MEPFSDFLQNFKDKMATDVFGSTTKESLRTGLCIKCKESALPKCYSDAGRSEFKISGLCELCFDEILE